MLKKLSNRPLLSSLFGTVTALLGAVAVVGCSSEESPGVCTSEDGLWQFPNCSDTSNYDYVGPAGVPCTTPDQLWTYTSCMVPGTGTYHGDCATTDSSWRLRVCSDPDTAYWVGAGPAPTTSAPPLTGQNPPVGVNPVAPVNPAVTPGGTVSPVVPTDTTMPVTPVAPAGTTTDTTTPVNPDTTVTPDTAAVTPDTTVTPDTAAVTPNTTDMPDTSDPVDPVSPVDNPVSGAGYYVTGDWHGCLWTAKDDLANPPTTLSPQDFVAAEPTGPFCVAGTIGPEENYESFAMVGYNINEAAGADCTYKPADDTVPATALVSQTALGIAVSVLNEGGSVLRLQLEGANADDGERWCADIGGSGSVLIEYDDLTQNCWEEEGMRGESFDRSIPIAKVAFNVPGNNTASIDYDFCVNGFAEGDDAEAAGSVNVGDTGQGVISGQYETRAVTRDGRNYLIHNNVWGSSNPQQELTFSSTSFTVTQQSSPQRDDTTPVSYPSVFIGAYETNSTAGSKLPIKLSAIQSLPTTFNTNADSISGSFNAAYDVWLDTGENDGTGIPTAAYLMVWTHDPGDRQPIDSLQNNGGTVDIEGQSWQVWYGPGGEEQGFLPVLSYVLPNNGSIPGGDYSFDLKAFLDHAVANYNFSNEWYLSNVFAGFEIWSGGQGLKVEDFTAVVNP